MGLHQCSEPLPNGVKYFRYSLQRGNTPGIHDWLLDIDSKFIRGEACAYAALELNRQGFIPDIICAHPGWGECLFLKEIWPSVPILAYQEFYYQSFGADFEYPHSLDSISCSGLPRRFEPKLWPKSCGAIKRRSLAHRRTICPSRAP